MPKFVLLWSDAVVLLSVVLLALYLVRVRRSVNLRATWHKVMRDSAALCSAVVLLMFFAVAVVDSVHFRRALAGASAAGALQRQAYATRTESLLDVALARQVAGRETSYSAPLAMRGFTKDTVEVAGKSVRIHPRLQHGGERLTDDTQWAGDVLVRTAIGLLLGLFAAFVLASAVVGVVARAGQRPFVEAWRSVLRNETELPLRAALITVAVLCALFGPLIALAQHYHVFGTDRTGNDVFYQALKSIRTAFVIGTLAVQYLYTVLSSIPNVLLIAACVLMMQVFIDTHPDMFETGAERADVRLFLLCVILGLTGWATLCRLLRAETMKLTQLDYVQAATAFGVRPVRIMVRHIFPNVVHLIIITTVLDFSALILYEAVLSYVGVGVDPSMNSFGGMINLARTEMSRDPLVWWSFAAAFGFMVTLVLAANLFADGVRDAFDPRARAFRPRLRKGAAA